MTAAENTAPTPITAPDVDTDHLAAALAYAAAGWRVIPIPPGLKRPNVTAWQKAGTTDTERITHWWTSDPTAGIGILTGPETGAWVLDIDTANGKVGTESLTELEACYGPLPATYEVVTGSGGRHLYFAWTPGHDIHNDQSGRIAPDIDVRGIGGQVLAPPTIHPNGNRYEHEAASPLTLAEAPGWLLELATRTEPLRPGPRATNPTHLTGDRPGDQWAAATSWAEILEPDGWTWAGTGPEGEDRWTRPGKTVREGISATTNYKGADTLKVFTSSLTASGLNAEETYSKIGYLAATRYDGRIGDAARALHADGYGDGGRIQGIELADLIGDTLGTKAGALQSALTPPPEPWDEPRGFEPATPRPAFPIHTLPTWIAGQVNNVTAQLECDPVLPAVFALGALSVASLGHIQFEVRTGQTERTTGLYLAVAGPPASGKSPALDMMFDPVRTHERTRITAAELDVAKADQARKIAQKAADKAADVAAATGDPGDAIKAAAAAGEVAGIEQPPHGELMTSDITPERLASLMAANTERMAIVSDEAGVLDVDRYGDKGAAKKLDIYLQAFTGQPVSVHRVKAPTVRLTRPLLAICAGVQPTALERAMADTEWRTRGMGARFLTAATDQLAANTDIDRDVWDTRIGDNYTDTLGRLCRRWASWDTPTTLHIAHDGRQRFSAWAADLRTREIAGDLTGESGWASKMRTSTLRIAALLQLADDPDGHVDQITDGTMARAIEIAEFFIAGHLHEAGDGASDAKRILAKLIELAEATDPTATTEREQESGLSRATNRFVARRDLARRGPRGLRTKEETAPGLRTLLEAGLIRLHVKNPAPNAQVTELVDRATGFDLHPEAAAHLDCATPRDTARQTPEERAEMTRSSDGVAHVAHVAEEEIPDSLSPWFSQVAASPTPHPRATSATCATETESQGISSPAPADATPPPPADLNDLF